jgi:hypothetical protein
MTATQYYFGQRYTSAIAPDPKGISAHEQPLATATDTAGGSPTPALADELKKLILEQMSRRLDRMFEGADDLLLSMSERARGSDEQRRYFDTKGLVRKYRPELTRLFRDELAAAFVPGAETKKKPETPDISLDELRLAKTRTIEESIAVNNIALKAENLNEQTLGEINRRVDYLIHERGAAISPAALAPSTLCNAFRVSTQSLNLDFQHELLIYKLFDKLVVAALGEVYAEALKSLEHGGITAAVLKTARRPALPRPQSASPPRAPAQPATQSAQGAAQMPDWATATTGFMAQTPGFAPTTTSFGTMPGAGAAPAGTGQLARAGGPVTAGMPALDPRTLSALHSAQGQGGAIAANYGDADLATELSLVASGQTVAGWGLPQARANIQCADLVGRMFNGIVEDTSVPQSLKPQLDDLRFAVIKSALADRNFFADPEHPIRKLVNELATMAAAARATGAGSIDQLTNLVAMIQSQFQVAAKAVRAAAAVAVPLAEADAERFLEDQQVQAKARRQALIDRARKVVSEVVQLRLLGRTIPAPAQPVLFSGVAPLLGLRLLRKGMDSDAWREGLQLLEKAVDALDPKPGTEPDAAELERLCAQTERELIEAGMVASRTAELLVGLRQGLEAAERQRQAVPLTPVVVDLAPPAPPPARPIALLLRLLAPGEWFKVYDAGQQQTRWLKVVAQHLDDERPQHRGRVTFAEFSGKNPMQVKVDDLLDDIVRKRTEPFDQSPGAKATLADLISQQQAWVAAAQNP